jgi:hypothetical protein
MKKLFTLTADNGEKLKIRVERNDDLSWRLDQIAPDWGCKPDSVTSKKKLPFKKEIFRKLFDEFLEQCED